MVTAIPLPASEFKTALKKMRLVLDIGVEVPGSQLSQAKPVSSDSSSTFFLDFLSVTRGGELEDWDCLMSTQQSLTSPSILSICLSVIMTHGRLSTYVAFSSL